ncbi:MAG: hypothetical protein PVG81_14915, partial [Desulfobacterales bacterium]
MNAKRQSDLTTETQSAQRCNFFHLPVLASRLGGGDDGKRKVSMLAHNENLHSNEYVGKIKGAD